MINQERRGNKMKKNKRILLSKVIVFILMFCLMVSKSIVVYADGSVEINGTNFPDDNFRSYIENAFDSNGDGILQLSELESVKVINCVKKNIADLTGVEHFTKLEKLVCGYNQLTNLDISSNTALIYLMCNKNELTTLNVSNNRELKELNCSENQLTNLDISSNTALTDLRCYKNKLTTLNVGNNSKLEYLYCYDNLIETLNINNNTALIQLNCSNNNLLVLDVSNNRELTYLNCGDNNLTTLNVDNNINLSTLHCSFNNLTSLNISNNSELKILMCNGNKLNSLDVSSNIQLVDLRCQNNKIASLDVSNNTALKNFYFENNQLTTLDLSKNKALMSFFVSGTYSTPQNCPTSLVSDFENGKYKFDLSTLFSDPNEDIARVMMVKLISDETLPETATYDEDTGILLISPADKIEAIIYYYDLKFAGNPNLRMRVIVNLNYTLKTFTVIYQDEHGNPVGISQTIEYGFDAIAEDVPEKTGYTGVWNHNGKNITVDTFIRPIYTANPDEIKMIKQPPAWIKGSNIYASFTSNAEFTDFLSVKVDGITVDEVSYKVEEGPTVVIFSPAFLKTLSIGNHTVEIISAPGTAYGILEIKAPCNVPETGDIGGYYLWLMLMCSSASGLIFLIRKKRIS